MKQLKNPEETFAQWYNTVGEQEKMFLENHFPEYFIEIRQEASASGDLNKEIGELEDVIEKLKEEIADLRKENNRIKTYGNLEIERLKDENKTLEKQLGSLDKINKDLHKENDALKNEIKNHVPKDEERYKQNFDALK